MKLLKRITWAFSNTRWSRPIAFSVFFHLGLFWLSDRALFEESTYAVASQVAGVSLELIPGPPPAEAAMVASVSSPQVQAPAEIPQKPEPVPPSKPEEKEFVKPKELKKKPKPRTLPSIAPVSAPAASISNAAESSSTTVASAMNVPNAIPGGTGQGGGSPDVKAEPDYLRNPPPTYPRESRKNGEEGVVLLAVSIGADGIVRELELKQSSTFERLDSAALEAVKSWKFKPAKIAGVAVASLVDVPVRFRLK